MSSLNSLLIKARDLSIHQILILGNKIESYCLILASIIEIGPYWLLVRRNLKIHIHIFLLGSTREWCSSKLILGRRGLKITELSLFIHELRFQNLILLCLLSFHSSSISLLNCWKSGLSLQMRVLNEIRSVNLNRMLWKFRGPKILLIKVVHLRSNSSLSLKFHHLWFYLVGFSI